MLYRKPRVGQEISAQCGRCKLERTHIVTAMDGETVRKVTCSMCGSLHNYREKTAAPASRARGEAKAASGSRRSKAEESFHIDTSRPAKPYDMGRSFSEGDVINHPKFGLGAVETMLSPNKIEVRFREGKKILLHSMRDAAR